jgi:hypothetical protein
LVAKASSRLAIVWVTRPRNPKLRADLGARVS